jgi:biopolymer transport protein ExbB
MESKMKKWLIATMVFIATSGHLLAQTATGDTMTVEGTAAPQGPGFIDIIYGGSIVNLFIWLLIFVSSFAMLAFVIDGLLQVRRDKILPGHLIIGVRDSLDHGDLDQAMNICETNPCQLSNILMAGFTNITEGYEVVQEAVSAATDIESEKIMQRIGYLNLCGQIAPMLGLLGTVTGMVAAFAGLASGGANKGSMLATAISTALWTTVCGLLIAVPALISFTIYKNIATQRLLESEATVLDLIKTLRNAEVGDEEEYEDDYLE